MDTCVNANVKLQPKHKIVSDREGTGEDPYLAGEWAYQYVKGLQEGEDPSTRKLLAVRNQS